MKYLRTRFVDGVGVATFWLFALVASAQTQVTRVDAIDLTPPKLVAMVDRVAVEVPTIDALSSLEISEDPIHDGIRYVFTNQGSEAVMLWTTPMRRASNGSIFPNSAELAFLEPGESKRVAIAFHGSPSGPYGEYRLLYSAAFRDRYYRSIPNQEYTEAGNAVRAFLATVRAKIEAEQARTSTPR